MLPKLFNNTKFKGKGYEVRIVFAFKCFDINTKMCVFWFGCYCLLTLRLIVFVVKSFTCINCVQILILTAKDVFKSLTLVDCR